MAEELACDEQHDGGTFEGVAEDVVHRAASLLRAMADAPRLRLLEQLALQPRCVSELADMSQDGMSTVSQRLKTLRNEGLVTRQRDGKHMYYRLADQHVADLVRVVLEHAAEPDTH